MLLSRACEFLDSLGKILRIMTPKTTCHMFRSMNIFLCLFCSTYSINVILFAWPWGGASQILVVMVCCCGSVLVINELMTRLPNLLPYTCLAGMQIIYATKEALIVPWKMSSIIVGRAINILLNLTAATIRSMTAAPIL